jgi:hypothetical protein
MLDAAGAEVYLGKVVRAGVPAGGVQSLSFHLYLNRLTWDSANLKLAQHVCCRY